MDGLNFRDSKFGSPKLNDLHNRIFKEITVELEVNIAVVSFCINSR